ncbi:MAG: ROK family protein, partial [Bryobacteraceae bacterium]
TRPHLITEGFVRAMRPRPAYVVAIDMGGTNTKYGVVSADRTLLFAGSSPTPFTLGRNVLLEHLKRIASQLIAEAERNSIRPARIGIATAGWVNPQSGNVVYATENLPGWTGTKIAEEVSKFCGLPVSVENDANALAVGEYVFGAARGVRDFICVTLGTGVGGGCYSGGKLHHGAHFFANALGHMPVVPDGENCTCGLKGCLEAYANAAALLRYANGRFDSAKTLIEAANTGDPVAAHAVRELARYLAFGLASAIQLLDPELVVLAGGLAQSNPLLTESLKQHLATSLTVYGQRGLRVRSSDFGFHAGVIGAAAVAMDRD